nr:MAG: hypothetical protein [Podoviridae sp. ctka020]
MKKKKNNLKGILTDPSHKQSDMFSGGGDMNFDSGVLFSGEEVKKTKPIPFEKEMKKEAGEILQKIRQKEKEWKEQFALETSLDFYFSVCFKSSQEMRAFLKRYGIKLHYGNHCFIEELLTAILNLSKK